MLVAIISTQGRQDHGVEDDVADGHYEPIKGRERANIVAVHYVSRNTDVRTRNALGALEPLQRWKFSNAARRYLEWLLGSSLYKDGNLKCNDYR